MVSRLEYLLYPPTAAPEPRTGWPLVVFLHGSGERGDDLEQVKKYGLPRYLEAGGRVPAYVAAPQCPADREWDDVLDPLEAMLDHLVATRPVSADRVSLTGFSMGGFGAWRWAIRKPRRFAAVAPVAGSRLPEGGFAPGSDPCALREVPVWIVHGVADRHVPIGGADGCAARLRECGGALRYTRYPDADHGQTCRRAYEDPALHRWLVEHQRGRRPQP